MTLKTSGNKWYEGYFLKTWLNDKPLNSLKSRINAINIIVDEYEKDLHLMPVKGYECMTSAKRYQVIEEYVKHHIEIKPKYEKLKQSTGLNNRAIAHLLGYKSNQSFENSLKQYRNIRAIVTIAELAVNNQFKKP